MRNFLSSLLLPTVLGLGTGCTSTNPTSEAASPLTGTLVDLTYAFDDSTIYWPTEEGFVLEHGTAGYTDKGYYYTANSFRSAEHGGTHLDAPVHFAEGKQSIDAIPLERLIGPAVVVDVTESALADPDYQITIADFERWEAAHGPLPDQTIVLLRTGYGRYWPQRQRYLGTTATGPEAVAHLHFPGLHPEAARWLVTERHVKAVGLDTPSIDYGQSTLFETHQTLFQENVPAFENVAHLDQLPDRGFTVVALPMKIRGGSGGPLRIIAIVP
ncbi:Kynurenine formamidase [Catalinimonas alkaloidigena]|uniref:Kynurenine formamidase n=1 Tax=Catalinimonas alkaloidigena TaxID=1075417 RepID=A0A1G9R9N4_9BACT|nr:cyclase family protein [Catalinimonas alkaloidigena]SDM19820.1 Kynurenine formamidase [Catalinimonas alkaloidigena]